MKPNQNIRKNKGYSGESKSDAYRRDQKRSDKQISTKEVMEAWLEFDNEIPFEYYIAHRKAVKNK